MAGDRCKVKISVVPILTNEKDSFEDYDRNYDGGQQSENNKNKCGYRHNGEW